MKTIVRLIWAAIIPGAVVFLAGCATAPQTATVRRAVPAYDFTVVEGSLARELIPQEIAQVRETVERYLAAQGAKPGGRYYVRVDFTQERPGEPVDWVVVKLNLAGGQAYAGGAAYSTEDPYYSPLDYRYGYPYGYDYASYGYYDPFGFNYGYYHYPRPPRDHKPGDRDDRDDHPRGSQAGDGRWPRTNDGHPRDDHASNDHRTHDKDGRPHDSQAGNGGRPPGDSHNRTADNPPRYSDPGQRRDGGGGGVSQPHTNSGGLGGGSSGVVHNPPPPRAPEPATRSDPPARAADRGNSADPVAAK